jgi:hypothetical protein
MAYGALSVGPPICLAVWMLLAPGDVCVVLHHQHHHALATGLGNQFAEIARDVFLWQTRRQGQVQRHALYARLSPALQWEFVGFPLRTSTN